MAQGGSGRLEAVFVAQARRTPDNLAILHRGRGLTYAELDRRSNQLARRLMALGAGPRVYVGLHLERSPDMVAAVLAVLKAGAAYVPLDPAYPRERLALILGDAAPSIVIADEALDPGLGHAGAVVSLARDAEPIAALPGEALAPAGSPDHPAYVIYTSGSTGRPKGVVLAHTASGFIAWARGVFVNGELGRVAAATSLCFDPSVFELFAPLAVGGTIVLKQDALEPFAPAERPTLLNGVPSAMAALCRAGAIPESVAAINVGGEVLTAALAREIYRRTAVKAVYNHYGPTEASTCTTVALVPPDVEDDPPIGRPIAGAEVHVLDEAGCPVAAGEVGEIHIGGPGLALGYLGRPDLTAERFPEDLLGPGSGRLYRTGDLGRRTAKGELHFVGRRDEQVKLRGFRVELGEIEAALAGLDGVRAAAALVYTAPSGRPDLIAFVDSDGADPDALRAVLANRLPGPMLPRRILVVDGFPLTLTGKVDKRALAARLDAQHEVHATAPRVESRIEEAIAELFRDLLKTPVGPEDSFFDLGGDSLLSVDAALRIEEVFGVAAPPALLHQAPTPRLLAQALEACEASPNHLTLLRAGEDGAQPLFCLSDLFARPFSYLSLARRLAPGRPVWGLSPGPLEARFAEARDIGLLTDAFLGEIRRVQPRGPYLLCGYSAGGLLAFDLARRLQAQGHEARLVLLDCARRDDPRLGGLTRWLVGRRRRLFSGSWRAKAERAGRTVLELGKRCTPAAAALPAWLPPDRRGFAAAMVEVHRRYGHAVFDGPALMVKCRERDGVEALLDHDGLLGWREALRGPLAHWPAPGNHHSFMRDPLAADLALAIDAWLDAQAAPQDRPQPARSDAA